MSNPFDTMWKVMNGIDRILSFPIVRSIFAVNSIPWGKGWKFYGIPIIQKHNYSNIVLGDYIQLRSSVWSNPLGANRPVILCTWKKGANLNIGNNFGMTGGTICVAEQITIGNNVIVGANSVIVDTDFHPILPDERLCTPSLAKTAPVIIGDNVFVGMNSLILKGVTIGKGSTIGAGSVVVKDVPSNVIVAGNPARIIRYLE